ncbi:MAG: HNH endonuclease [Actinomycetota bacterium]|nr:HNH endonuclease [Actinomycetota bacterium]
MCTSDGLVGRLAEVVEAWVDLDPEIVEVGEVGELLRGLDRQLNRLQAAAFALTASFDRRQGHRRSGHRNAKDWLASELRQTPGRACNQLRAAHLLEAGGLEATRAALRKGDISGDHVAAIARTAEHLPPDPDAEQTLLGAARTGDAYQVGKVGERLAQQADVEAARHQARRAYEQRQLSLRRGPGGVVWLDGRLHQLGGEKVATALNALAAPASEEDTRSYSQRLADAIVELADRGLRAGKVPRDGGVRPQVLVTVPLHELETRAGAQPGTLSWSGPCPPQVLEELVCEAELSWLVTDPTGLPLHLGRTRRFASVSQRLALWVRDGGCRWPGCPGRAEWAIAHHTPEWKRGGLTDLDKLAFLCPTHHGLVHDGGWALTLQPDATITVRSPDGGPTLTETAAQARARHHATTLDPSATPTDPRAPLVAREAPDNYQPDRDSRNNRGSAGARVGPAPIPKMEPQTCSLAPPRGCSPSEGARGP